MKNALFLLLCFLALGACAQEAPIRGLYCSALKGSERWCFKFNDQGNVEATLGGRDNTTWKEDFLPTGFTSSYKVSGDTISFLCFLDGEPAFWDYPASYRYNYFTIIRQAAAWILYVQGYNAKRENREKYMPILPIR